MPTPAKTRGRYAKSAAIRQRVLDACVEAFGESGFYGATMKDIADRAGMSHTSLLHHFPNKESLLMSVLVYRDERGANRYEEALAALSGEGVDLLRGTLGIVIANELEPGLIALHATLSAEATTPDHPAYDYFRQRYRSIRSQYETYLSDLAERGLISPLVAPESLAIMMIALLDGLQIQYLYENRSIKMEDVISDFIALLQAS